MQRFSFRFFCFERYEEQSVVIVGTHWDDAKTAAWAVLGEQTADRNPRQSWRLVSTVQEPVLRAVES